MNGRGSYRPIYAAILRDRAFREFSPNAKLLFFIIKLSLGPSGIDSIDEVALAAAMGCEAELIRKLLDELADAKWVRYEETAPGLLMLWLVRGLEFEPHHQLGNEKIRKGVEKHLKGLQKSHLIRAFCDQYGFPVPDWLQLIPEDIRGSLEAPSNGIRTPLRAPSKQENGMRDTGDGIRRRGKSQDPVDEIVRSGHRPTAIRRHRRDMTSWEHDERWSKVEYLIEQTWGKKDWPQMKQETALAPEGCRDAIYAVASDAEAAERAGRPIKADLVRTMLIKAINSSAHGNTLR